MTDHEHLHIFVNRRRFGRAQGVMPEMTGAQIAALVHIAADLAVIRRETPPHAGEIGVNQIIHLHDGEHFLVTRRVVEGGAC
jgi:hypothetical protein